DSGCGLPPAWALRHCSALREMKMEIKTVGVVGAGTMGNGIAHVLATHDYPVLLVDVQQEFLDRGLATIGKNTEREVNKQKLTAEQRDAALRRIRTSTDRQELTNWDCVVEAATQRFDTT